MSRTFLDDDLRQWEAYPSGGRHGLAEGAYIIFHCLSDPEKRARRILHEGSNAEAGELVLALPDEELRAKLERAEELY
jgi:hypothetical protein